MTKERKMTALDAPTAIGAEQSSINVTTRHI